MPLSSEEQSFTKACEEWLATGNCYLSTEDEESCELCQHEHLSKQFEIKNKINNNTLWVGSKCICRFNIIVYDNGGKEVFEDKKEDYLQKHFKNTIIQQYINCLISKNNSTTIKGYKRLDLDKYCLENFKKFQELTPKITNYLFKRFEEECITFIPYYFRPNIQSNKLEFYELNETQFNRISASLTKKQITSYKNHKY